MKARYLTFFSYIGTRFRSSEKIWLKDNKPYPDNESVQGMIELGLSKLKPQNCPKITLSSRTDGGVHALCNSAHFDLEKYGDKYYEPCYIAHKLNDFFYKTDTEILIKNCIKVPDDFSARYKAISRTYLYRFAVLKKGINLPENISIASYIPIEEWRRCYYIRRFRNFDIEKFKEASKYFVGYHDFATFKRYVKTKQYKHTRREIKSIEVQPGARLLTSFSQQHPDVFDYWEVQFKGRGFVHNQIRRMMGTMIGVAIGRLPPEEIKVMLQVPSKHSWNTSLQCCPPDGLYLCDVEYKPEDLIYNPEQTPESIESVDSDSNS